MTLMSFFLVYIADFWYNFNKVECDNMNKKGQALVEFIILLPIFLLLITILYDIGNIFYNKLNLQKDLDTVKDLYKQNNTLKIEEYISEKDYEILYSSDDDLTTITLEKKLDVIGIILEDPFKIKESITIVKEG